MKCDFADPCECALKGWVGKCPYYVPPQVELKLDGHIDKATCVLCGEPMPVGEEMFRYHGYSGPCPKPRDPTDEKIPEIDLVLESTPIEAKSRRVPLSGGKPETPDGPTPTDRVKPGGQYADYWVLSEEERAKGFVRPVRSSYKHVGIRPEYPLRDLTEEEVSRFSHFGYVKYEEYPKGSDHSSLGRYWTERTLSSGCGTVTSMSRPLAETYARDPKFYGSTFCCGCHAHLSVEEFVWEGTDERVGS